MKRRIRSVLAAVCLLAGAPVFAQGPLGQDPTAIPEFTGTASFNAGDQLLVELDFAVFLAGVYPNNGINGNDPSNGTEFVYAYQAFNISPSASLTTVTVGLVEGNLASNAFADPLHELTGGLAPTSTGVNQLSLSVITRFLNPPLPAQDYSTFFLFTSPLPPQFLQSSVQSGGLVDTQLVPSPIPEPGTLALLGASSLLMMRRRRSSAG